MMIWLPFCVNLVDFGPVTPKFKYGKDVQPLVFFFKTNLSDKLAVLFPLFSRGVTAMPRGLHAGLCHAFLGSVQLRRCNSLVVSSLRTRKKKISLRWLKERCHAMPTNFRVKIGKIDYLPLFVALAFRNGLQYRHSDF